MKRVIAVVLFLAAGLLHAEECAELNMCISQGQRVELVEQEKFLFKKANSAFVDQTVRDLFKARLNEFKRCMSKNDQPSTPRLAYIFCLNEDILTLKIEHMLLEVDPDDPEATTYVVEYER